MAHSGFDRVDVGLVAAMGLTLGLGVGAALHGTDVKMWSQEAAGYLQAIGSFGALLIAIKVAKSQSDQSLRQQIAEWGFEKRQEAQRCLAHLVEFAPTLHKAADDLEGCIFLGSHYVPPLKEIAYITTVLQELVATQQDHVAVKVLHRLRRMVLELQDWCSQPPATLRNSKASRSRFAIEGLRSAVDESIAALDKRSDEIALKFLS